MRRQLRCWGLVAMGAALAACGDSGTTDATINGANQTPTINGTPATSVSQNAPYLFTPTASDADGDPLIFGIDAKPAWAIFNTTTGQLSGTPAATDAGTYRGIVVWVSDGKSQALLPAFDLTVTGSTSVNRAPTISGTPPPSVTAGNAYTFTPTANDPDGNAMTFAIVNRPQWASFSAANGRLQGTPQMTDVGTFANVVISVSDGQAAVALPTFSVAVMPPATNAPPTISGTPMTSVAAGTSYGFVPTASDANGDTLTFGITNKPGWAAFNASTGALTGTPASAGTFNGIVISVSDGSASASLAPFAITVTAPTTNHPPTISGTPATTATQGTAYSFQATAADADGDPLTFSIANRPSWATFNVATGVLQGTPGASNVGTFNNIVISVSDGKASASLSAFSITVASSNRPPTISGTPPTTATVGTQYTFTPSASDPDAGTTLTFSVTNKPSWATFTASTGRLQGTPASGNVGTFANIGIQVSDGQASAQLAAFTITVSAAPNRPPTISGTPTTSVESGTAYAFVPTASDPDGDTLTFSVTGLPSWATFNTSTGRLAGTPPTTGTFNGIAISVSDGSVSASLAPFSITVTAPTTNNPPTISGTPATTATQGTAYSFQATAADADSDPLTFSIANRPTWATFNANTGLLQGTPGAGNVGTFNNIVISVSDGKASASLSAFSITVASLNTPPTISGAPPTTATVGTQYTFTPSASDPDAGTTLTFSVTNKPSWATFTASTGRLQGTPASGNVGTFANIGISVSDGQASAQLASFTITVSAPPNRAPTISGTPPNAVMQGTAYTFTPTASDPDGDTLTFSITNKPSWATFNTSTGRLQGTPGAGDVGTTTGVVIGVSDGSLSASLGAFSLTVQAVATGSATLSWTAPTQNTDGSPLTDLAGYKIYWGTSQGNYPNSVTVNNPGLTTYVVDNLVSGTYFFVASAFNTTGTESTLSGVASKTIQ